MTAKKRKRPILILSLILILGAVYYVVTVLLSDHSGLRKIKKIKHEVSFVKEGTLWLTDKNGDTLKQLDIEFARSEYETQTGLMYRKKMLENRGMLFIFNDEKPRSFYMKNTYIPLDIIFVKSNGEIVSISKNAEPLNEKSIPSQFPAKYVLEINAGLSDKWGLQQGGKMHWKSLADSLR